MDDSGFRGEATLALLDEQSFAEGAIIAEGAVICEDADVNSDVLLLNEDSSLISFSCAAPHRYLCLFLKSLDSFVTMELDVVDQRGVRRSITTSNHQSVARVMPKTCSLPLSLTDGWNYVCIDVADLQSRSFGVRHAKTTGLRVRARCCLWRVFFQSTPLAYTELPDSLSGLLTQ